MLAQAPADPGLTPFLMLPQLHWLELIVRAVVVYVFLVVLIRITGRRQVGMMSPTDFILLLILSNAVQNSMNGGDNSLGAGLVLAAALIALNYAMSWLARRSKFIEQLLVGRPVFIVRDGRLDEHVLAKEKVTHHELMAALRAAGCPNIEAARHVILETNGSISVIHRGTA
jgi:uncharacterized membrane protein YcaP (DUF421 family)